MTSWRGFYEWTGNKGVFFLKKKELFLFPIEEDFAVIAADLIDFCHRITFRTIKIHCLSHLI